MMEVVTLTSFLSAERGEEVEVPVRDLERETEAETEIESPTETGTEIGETGAGRGRALTLTRRRKRRSERGRRATRMKSESPAVTRNTRSTRAERRSERRRSGDVLMRRRARSRPTGGSGTTRQGAGQGTPNTTTDNLDSPDEIF